MKRSRKFYIWLAIAITALALLVAPKGVLFGRVTRVSGHGAIFIADDGRTPSESPKRTWGVVSVYEYRKDGTVRYSGRYMLYEYGGRYYIRRW